MNCPICNAKCIIICDNGCGTEYCTNNHEFYVIDNKGIIGHNPICGSSSSSADENEETVET